MPLFTPRFRVSYPHVFKAQVNKLSGKEQFSVVALFPKGTDLSELIKAADACVLSKWPNVQTRPKNLRTPFRKHEERATEAAPGQLIFPAGMEAGGIFVNLTSNNPPGVVEQLAGGAVQKIIDPTAFYAGCWAIATVNPYAYDQAGNRGVALGLNNLMKVGDGDPISGRPTAEEEFVSAAGGQGGAAAGQSPDSIFGGR